MARVLFALLLLIAAFTASAGEFRVNVYGVSYHPDRAAAHRAGTDNQKNPGLGLNYTFSSGVFVEAGFYKDSGSNTAKFTNLGYYYPVGMVLVGGALTLFHSDTYNGGKVFIAPVPSAAIEFKRFRVHGIWFPKVSGFNEVEAFGFYVSAPFK